MSARFLWLIGPSGACIALLGLSLVLDSHFQQGLPPARSVSPVLVAWLALGATLLVVAAWLLGAWRSGSRRP